VLSTKVKLTLLLVVAPCLQVSKLQVKAGALLGLRKLVKFHLDYLPSTLVLGKQKTVWRKPAVFFIL
jgi:hypothetical protein